MRKNKEKVMDMNNNDIQVLSTADMARYLEHKLRVTPPNPSGQGIDRSLLAYADKYNIKGDMNTKLLALTNAVMVCLQGVDGYFTHFASDIISQMNKEYFGCMIDAFYTKNTLIAKMVKQAIAECQKCGDTTFTSTELLLSAKHIVKDYERFVRYAERIENV